MNGAPSPPQFGRGRGQSIGRVFPAPPTPAPPVPTPEPLLHGRQGGAPNSPLHWVSAQCRGRNGNSMMPNTKVILNSKGGHSGSSQACFLRPPVSQLPAPTRPPADRKLSSDASPRALLALTFREEDISGFDLSPSRFLPLMGPRREHKPWDSCCVGDRPGPPTPTARERFAGAPWNTRADCCR